MKKKKTTAFFKNEGNRKEMQLYEAIQNRSILEPLESEGLSLGELQTKLEQMKNLDVKKTTLASRISRLRTAGLIRKQTKQIEDTEVRSPHYRGWRIKQKENGTYEAELGFELTKNGKEALHTIRSFTEGKGKLPQEPKTDKKEGEKNE